MYGARQRDVTKGRGAVLADIGRIACDIETAVCSDGGIAGDELVPLSRHCVGRAQGSFRESRAQLLHPHRQRMELVVGKARAIA
jgi:hypothetical protein